MIVKDYTKSGKIIWRATQIKSSYYTLQVYYHNILWKVKTMNKEELFNKVTREEAEAINGGRDIIKVADTDYVGNDIINTTTSLFGCEQSCLSNPSCAGFTYYEPKQSCWLKNKLEKPTPKKGVTSGVIVW